MFQIRSRILPDPLHTVGAGAGSSLSSAPDPESGSTFIPVPDPDTPELSGSGWIRIVKKQAKTLGKKSLRKVKILLR